MRLISFLSLCQAGSGRAVDSRDLAEHGNLEVVLERPRVVNRSIHEFTSDDEGGPEHESEGDGHEEQLDLLQRVRGPARGSRVEHGEALATLFARKILARARVLGSRLQILVTLAFELDVP